ncbi:hypothetical protein I6E36_04845 [Fusobacterium mortiferum]|uniref:hypothetical protein n=1 Tax=Fusobacterium mortiferum TaxID=850 RepID=UPI001F439FFF|nr:hypothetical protein [Fusobacterium mortiferum]MCF2627405.1 hypothetical protein [Fusobacterium mortiferum]MCF2698899.1 hypothetical protein [Fusobacterium mortiferum]
MRKNFNQNLYKEEIINLIKSSIEKLKREYPNYKVLTMSITSDFSSGISAVHFDSENFSKNYLQKEKEKYKYYLEKNDIEKAEIYKPTDEIRITNPADFELAFYIEISHKSFSLEDFEDKENYEGYAILKEVLKENYDYIIKELKVNSNFELTYNDEEDWYNSIN